MTCLKQMLAAVLSVLLLASSVDAQQSHIANARALEQAIAGHQTKEEADRAVVLGVLSRPEVRSQAARLGLSSDEARAAVATLSGTGLQEAAAQAQRIDQTLAGGGTVTITTTTLIIILLVVILLIVAVK